MSVERTPPIGNHSLVVHKSELRGLAISKDEILKFIYDNYSFDFQPSGLWLPVRVVVSVGSRIATRNVHRRDLRASIHPITYVARDLMKGFGMEREELEIDNFFVDEESINLVFKPVPVKSQPS